MINKYSDERMMDFASKYSDEPATKFRLSCLESLDGQISIDIEGQVDEYSASVFDMSVFIADGQDGWTEVKSWKDCVQLFKQHNMEQLVIAEINNIYGIYTDAVKL